jgi:hypothetical protein
MINDYGSSAENICTPIIIIQFDLFIVF